MRLSIPIRSELVSIEVQRPKDAEKKGLPSWSLQSLQGAEDIFKFQNKKLIYKLKKLFDEHEIREAYSLNTDVASARIVKSHNLFRICLSNDVFLYRNRFLSADGIFLNPGTALVMDTEACPIIIAVGGPHMIVARATRDSLVDREVVWSGIPSRKYISVVHAIVDEFEALDVPRKEVAMCMLFSVPALLFVHRFDDPDHGIFNQMFFDYVDTRWHGSCLKNKRAMFVNLESIFINQAIELGMRYVYALSGLDKNLGLEYSSKQKNLLVIKREKKK